MSQHHRALRSEMKSSSSLASSSTTEHRPSNHRGGGSAPCSLCSSCACGGGGRGRRDIDDDERDRAFECSICLGGVRDAVVSLCGHLFCWPCLHRWLAQRPACPVCGSALGPDKVVPLFGRGGGGGGGGGGGEEDPSSSRDTTTTTTPPRPPALWTEPLPPPPQHQDHFVEFEHDFEEDFDEFGLGWDQSRSAAGRVRETREFFRRNTAFGDPGRRVRLVEEGSRSPYMSTIRGFEWGSRGPLAPPSSSSSSAPEGLYVPPPRRLSLFSSELFEGERVAAGRAVAGRRGGIPRRSFSRTR